MKKRTVIVCAGLSLLVLAGCGGQSDVGPPPVPHVITDSAIGYFCSMNLLEHDGPKGQVLLPGQEEAIWFSTIRQTIAYTMLPEAPRVLSAVYVSDLSAVDDWRRVDPEKWVDARQAWFVVESRAVGGMGGEDPMPFSDRSKAEQFALTQGGRVLPFKDLSENYILYSGDLYANNQMPEGILAEGAPNQHE